MKKRTENEPMTACLHAKAATTLQPSGLKDFLPPGQGLQRIGSTLASHPAAQRMFLLMLLRFINGAV